MAALRREGEGGNACDMPLSGFHRIDRVYSYMKSLEDRVAYLETQLMAHGIQDIGTTRTGLSTPDRIDFAVTAAPLQESHAQQSPLSQDLVEQIAHGSLQRNLFAESVTNRDGVSLLSSLLADPIARTLRSDSVSDHHVLLHELPFEPRASMPPKNAAAKLIDTYFEHCDFFSPIMASKNDFFDTLQPLYNDGALTGDKHAVNAKFRAFIVFGTAVLLLNRSDSSVPISRAEGYFAVAMRVLSQESHLICTGDLDHLTNLLLIIQHCCFSANLTAAWHILGLAARLAVELSLHNERGIASSRLTAEELDIRRWLFWSTYVFERNLCVIIGRPFSIPDEAIQTPLPAAAENEARRNLALHLIKCRQLESEMYTTMNYKRPSNGALLDATAWRNNMHHRLVQWHSSVPVVADTELTGQFTHPEIFGGFFANAMVLLYYPSSLIPTSSPEDLRTLAEYAGNSIEAYKHTFRSGRLRFYWRTVHNLFRSGMAVVYCIRAAAEMQLHLELGHGDLKAMLHSCSSILWGMVERYPAGKAYRDIFEAVVSSVINEGEAQPSSMTSDRPFIFNQGEAEQRSTFDPMSIDFEGIDLPLSAIDTLSWGFSPSLQDT